MRFEEAKLKAISLEYAISLIKNNNSNSYIWYPVRNKKKILIEVGGMKGDIKAYIPSFDEKGNYLTHQNGFIKHAYGLNNKGKIEYSTFYGDHELNEEELIKFLNTTDFKTYSPTIIEKEEVEIKTYLTAKL
jgi:hypothetical protein